MMLHRLYLKMRCRGCGRIAFPAARDIGEKAGYDTRVSDLRRRGRCTACGRREIEVEVLVRDPWS